MKVHLLKGRTKSGYVTFGSVYKPGEIVASKSGFSLKKSSGEIIPVQSRVTAIWPDGSVKWASHTANAELIGDGAEIECVSKDAQTEDIFSVSSNLNLLKNEEDVGDIEKIVVTGNEDTLKVNTGKITISVQNNNHDNRKELFVISDQNGNETVGTSILKLEEREKTQDDVQRIIIKDYVGKAEKIQLLEKEPLQAVIRFDGIHESKDGKKDIIPFRIYMYCFAGSSDIKFTYTFFYDGDANKDFLKGYGIKLTSGIKGNAAERFIFAGTDKGNFKEASALMFSSHPKLPENYYSDQLTKGIIGNVDENEDAKYVLSNVPIWNDFSVVQDSSYHYRITKRTREGFCYLNSREGSKVSGNICISGTNGGVHAGIRDMWKKYPAELEVCGLSKEKTDVYLWFYSPKADSYDFRHYDDRSYVDTLYEGFKHQDPSPVGIAVTSEGRLQFFEEKFPEEKALSDFEKTLNNPPVYVLSPEDYHDKKAFGHYSLPSKDTEVMELIENQLQKEIDFYKEEISSRDWYGLFDYGDVMHKYDTVRHTWRYDMGGFAWQNTELIPTYLLWLSFLRTGDSEIFTMAEAMSRHCSEVDMYHFGEKKGIGTRHNVRHWGCPCKEPRVSMAGHHRFYYYLTGDYRIGEVMRDSVDADKSMVNVPYFKTEKSTRDGKEKLCIRCGPDWTSLLANWMTEYERTGNKYYLEKIQAGVDDIYKTPFGLASGPEYLLDLDNGHLEYTGEHDESTNMHLQVCQGGTEIWIELVDVLGCTENGSDKLKKLLADYGSFYMLTKEEKEKFTEGKISKRPFSFPYFASAMSAFSAYVNDDEKLAETVVEKIFTAIFGESNMDGFVTIPYGKDINGNDLKEIPWLSTNFASQWGVNMIVALEFIKEYFPKTIDELKEKYVSGKENFHLA